MWFFSLLAWTSCKPITPSGVLFAFKACSVTIHTYPDSVIFNAAASRNIVYESSLLEWHGLHVSVDVCECIQMDGSRQITVNKLTLNMFSDYCSCECVYLSFCACVCFWMDWHLKIVSLQAICNPSDGLFKLWQIKFDANYCNHRLIYFFSISFLFTFFKVIPFKAKLNAITHNTHSSSAKLPTKHKKCNEMKKRRENNNNRNSKNICRKFNRLECNVRDVGHD